MVPCTHQLDGRCYFWVWSNEGKEPHPECCPTSFTLQYATLNVWDGNDCVDYGAYYCVEKDKYKYDNWTANETSAAYRYHYE